MTGTPAPLTPTQNEEDPSQTNCLDASLSMLHTSMEHAKAYEYLLHQTRQSGGSSSSIVTTPRQNISRSSLTPTRRRDSSNNSISPFPPAPEALRENIAPMPTGAAPAPHDTQATQAAWWLRVLHRQEQQHEQDREQWQQRLVKAKKHSTDYKQELKSNLQQQLHWLEYQKHLKQDQDDAAGVPSLSAVSTGSTSGSAFGSSGDSTQGESVYTSAGLEVTYESSEAVRKLAMLERAYEETVKLHESEREEWVEKLDMAAKVTSDGERVSKNMQSQLLDLADGIEKGNEKQRQRWKERVEALEQLVELTEQQHKAEKTEWNNEKDTLESAVEQLAANVQEQKTELEKEAYEKEVLQKTVAQLVADKARIHNEQVTELAGSFEVQKRQWQNEKQSLKNQVSQLTTELNGQGGETKSLKSKITELTVQNSKLQEIEHTFTKQSPRLARAESFSTPSPRRLEWDDKLDRAMIERDMFQQEAEKIKRALDEMEPRQTEQIAEWKQRLDQKEQEWRDETNRQLQECRDQQVVELHNLEKELDSSSDEVNKRFQQSVDQRNELVSRIRKLEQQQVTEKGTWKLRLEGALLEARTLRDEKIALEDEQEHMQAKHAEEIAESEARLQTSRAETQQETEQLLSELEATRQELEENLASGSPRQESAEELQHTVISAVEELRLDVVSIRETIKASAETDTALESSHNNQVQSDLERIQESLYDAVAELTLETEAMLESRKAIKSLADQVAASHEESRPQNQPTEVEEQVLTELGDIRSQLSSLAGSEPSLLVATQDALRELAAKEGALDACKAELERTKVELVNEKRSHRRSRKPALAHVNADGNTPMRPSAQDDETGEPFLEDTERDRMNLNVYSEDAFSLDGSVDVRPDDASPMLEEALALAQGLTDIVHGRDNDGKESSVMEMLESLSEMMDQADKVKDYSEDPSGSATSDCCHSDAPPDPVSTPMPTRNSESSALDLVVQQLYRRCQLLESERAQIMEVTMDLLETARDANTAEIDAALVVFRQKSSEELVQIQERNRTTMASLYQRLCGKCQHGMLEASILP